MTRAKSEKGPIPESAELAANKGYDQWKEALAMMILNKFRGMFTSVEMPHTEGTQTYAYTHVGLRCAAQSELHF